MALDMGMQDKANVVQLHDFRLKASSLKASNDNEHKQPVKTVTVRTKLDKSGVAIKIKVPVSEYFGVAVSTSISDEGQLTSAIELVHKDKSLNYRVFQEMGNSDVIAEWQNWGKKLQLPLFIRSGDGDLMPYSQMVGGVVVGDNAARRRTIAEGNRRPRFLNRREPGAAS